uniref:Putative secreted protein n=1 Tax=Rhipicephalus microplus TaxID=6941 RepID=A0A6M2DAA8_RHIMP
MSFSLVLLVLWKVVISLRKGQCRNRMFIDGTNYPNSGLRQHTLAIFVMGSDVMSSDVTRKAVHFYCLDTTNSEQYSYGGS